MATAMTLPMLAAADRRPRVGGSGTTATARLDFRITIGDFVFFRVGTPGSGIVDLVEFDLTAAGTESGAGGPPFAATSGNGGALTIELRTNVANVTIGATGPTMTGPLADITVTNGGAIPVPALGGSMPFAPLPGNNTDTWTYRYNNANVYAPGQYNGQVVYTVATP